MSTTSATKSQSLENARREANAPRVQAVDVKEDLVEYMTCYAKQNPAHAALVCLGVGFILGWKLKPW